MRITKITTEDEYNKALLRFEQLLDNDLLYKHVDTELELLGYLIEKYEEENYPLPEPTEEDIKRFKREQRGIKD